MPEVAPAWLSVYPLIAFAGLVSLVVLRGFRTGKRGGRIVAGDVLAPMPALLLLVASVALVSHGMVDADVSWPDMLGFSLASGGVGALAAFRSRAMRGLDALPRRAAIMVQVAYALVAAVFVSVVSAWAVDFAWLETSGDIGVRSFSVTVLVFMLLCLPAYFLGQQTGVAMMLVPLAAAGFGIAQYFVMSFKGLPIMPSDLLAIDTAGAVAGGYDFVLVDRLLWVLFACCLCMSALAFIEPIRVEGRRARRYLFVGNASAGVALAGMLSGLFGCVQVSDLTQCGYDRWMPVTTYEKIGFVPAFIEVAQDFAIPVPEDYNEKDAASLVENLVGRFDAGLGAAPERRAAVAQFDELHPTVIAVMNETFTDLSIYEALRDAGYEGPAFYNSLQGTLQRGALMMSVYGGGTANSEFEFLTGNSMAFIGSEKIPYQLYNFSHIDNLARSFAELGYSTTAMHPLYPTNYKRNSVYEKMGFDRFLSLEDFEDAPTYHAGATDAATYDEILELLQDEAPQFIFDVTLQNHGGYADGSVPAEDVVRLDIPGVEDASISTELGVYLACIERSDSDLAYLIERLSMLDRPVVLVFFGDHQPGLSVLGDDLLQPDADDFARTMKKAESTYFVWSNYEIAGSTAGEWREMGASQLAAGVLYRIGAPLSERQKADLVLGEQISSINYAGYRGADGLRYVIDADSPHLEALHQMQTVQYAFFGSRVR